MRRLSGRLGSTLLLCGLLVLALGSLTAGAAQPTTDGPHVRVIVTLKEQATLADITGTSRRQRGERVIRALQEKADSTQKSVRQLLEAHHLQGSVREYTPYWIFNGLAVTATPDLVAKLARRPEVLKVEPDATLSVPTDIVANSPESNLDLIRAPELWALGYRGDGVVVASMDTGVDASHPDLAPQWRGGTNSWFDPSGQHPTTPIDTNGHGTRTMGVLVGRDAGGTAVGVAPDASWIAVKVFDDSGNAPFTRVHDGFQWLLDPDGNPVTPDAPHVVNNSWTLAGSGCNLEFQLDLQALRAAGIVPIFAAGNYGPSAATSRSPANNPEALAVGASTNTDTIWTSSARGPSSCPDSDPTYPELVAPGTGIRTTDRFGGYVTASGTSLAAPHVAGTVVLLAGAHPGTSAAQFETALESTAVDLGDVGPDDTYGYGRLDALAAHEWLAAPPPNFTLLASPSSASTTQGGSVSYTVSVAPQGGFDTDVALSLGGLPPGATATFIPPAIAGGSGSSQLDVSTSPSTPVGSYPLTITGMGGSLSHSASVTMLVDAPASFALSASPASANVPQGGSADYTVSVTTLNGFSGDVTLAVDGLPAGATATFTPPIVMGGASSSQLAISTTPSTPVGTSTLTITGTSGQLVSTTSALLTVEASTATAVPDSTTVITGSLRGGTAASLASDDDSFYEVNSNLSSKRTTSWRASFLSVPNGLTDLRITYTGMNSRACTQTIAAWRWTTHKWVVLDSRTVGTTEVVVTDLVPPGSPGDFVSGTSGNGELRMRVLCWTRSGAFFASGDLLRLVYNRP